MKILVVSDTHREEGNLAIALEREEDIDMLLHAGDIEGSETKIELMSMTDCIMVRGNNDFFSHLDDEEEVYIGDYKILLTHGHFYSVSLGVERLRAEAKSRGFNMAIFGHTHRPFYENEDGLILLNPGSLSYPRQEGKRASYAIMSIDDDGGEAEIEIKYI